MAKNRGIHTLTQTLIVTTFFFLPTQHSYTSSSSPLAKSIGVTIQDFVTISSSFSSPSQTFKGTPGHKIVELKLSWALLLPDVASQIRHNCGKNLFNGMIKSSYNKGKDYTKSTQTDLLKSVNCSFTKDHAVLTLYHDSHSDFAVSLTRRIIALRLSPFQGEDSNEVCSIKLRGYEKFGVIFVAYKKTGGDGLFTIVKFPKGFVKFVDVVGLEKRGSSVSIFDPKAGKGKTFLRSKDCIQVLLRLRRDEDEDDGNDDLDLDVIENFCIIECQDVSPGADKKVGKVQKIRNKTKTNTPPHREKTEL
ncbi:hypothetical protein Fcan01_14252 [Folsomia candida]|uniref:Uncharacterized protein n=1 Tax=Folsomia candida TaxID=158441 RepID=A0A226DZP2_FOLCA|nr:hypothetical protein Fcan01_14252 [Folsomia candida]